MHSAPPSTTIVCPVIHEAASEHRNSPALAMSSASPRRRSGSRRAIASPAGSHRALANPVLTRPGATALTRTLGPSSPASWLVRFITAALVTLYQPTPPSTESPPMEARLRMTPPWSAMPERHAAWDHSRYPDWLTLTVLSARAVSRSMMGP